MQLAGVLESRSLLVQTTCLARLHLPQWILLANPVDRPNVGQRPQPDTLGGSNSLR